MSNSRKSVYISSRPELAMWIASWFIAPGPWIRSSSGEPVKNVGLRLEGLGAIVSLPPSGVASKFSWLLQLTTKSDPSADPDPDPTEQPPNATSAPQTNDRPALGADAARGGAVAAGDLQLAAAADVGDERPRLDVGERPAQLRLEASGPCFDLHRRVGPRPLDHLGRQRGDEVAEAVDVNHLPLDHTVATVQRGRAQLHHRCEGRAGVGDGGAGGQPSRGRREDVAAMEGRADRLPPKGRRLDPVDLPRAARGQREHAVVRTDEEPVTG